MALLTAQGISNVAIEFLRRQLALPRTVTMVPGSEFSGSNGDTITLRVPLAMTARTQASRGAALTADTNSEVGVDVTMAHKYSLRNLSDQEIEFDIEDFGYCCSCESHESTPLEREKDLEDLSFVKLRIRVAQKQELAIDRIQGAAPLRSFQQRNQPLICE